MNNLAEQQEQALPVDEAVQILIASINQDAKESDELIDYAEKLEQENTFLKLQLSNVKESNERLLHENSQLLEARKADEETAKAFNKKAQMVSDNATKHMHLLEQKDRELVQAQTQMKDIKATNKEFKTIASTPKKMREKIKTLQENVAKQQGFVTQHKLTIKTLEHEKKVIKETAKALSRQLDELDYTKVYSKNGDNVAIFPMLTETDIGQGKEKQIPLLYMNDEGIGALYMLNEDEEPARAKTPRTGIKPKPETLEVMGTLLRKFKLNGNVVHADDVKLLETV